MEEVWRDIEGYDGYYQISNLGRVKGLKRVVKGKNGTNRVKKEHILKLNKNHDGYLIAALSKQGIVKYIRVHRLVAKAFLKNPNNFPIINHKNEIKTDNRAENLEWCTISYNNSYGEGSKRRAISKSKPIKKFDLNGNLLCTYKSIKEASDDNNINIGSIIAACKGGRKHYGKWETIKTLNGFIWRYCDET